MKGRLLLAFSIVLLILSFLPLHLLHPPSIFIAGQYDLSPSNVNGPSTFLPFLTVSVLDVAIQGANGDVYFYITNPDGKRVFDADRIYNGYHLDWAPSQTFNTYTFNFDNSMSYTSHKFVNYSLQVFPYATILFVLGILFLAVGLVQTVREEKLILKLKKFLFPPPISNNIICDYCGTVYSKAYDKCPNCGARNKR